MTYQEAQTKLKELEEQIKFEKIDIDQETAQAIDIAITAIDYMRVGKCLTDCYTTPDKR